MIYARLDPAMCTLLWALPYTATAIPFKYSFSGNCEASAPNFHIHVSVSDLYVPRIGPHISSSRKGRPIVGIYNSLTDTWMWKLGLRPHIPFLGIFVSNFRHFVFAVYCSVFIPNGAFLKLLQFITLPILLKKNKKTLINLDFNSEAVVIHSWRQASISARTALCSKTLPGCNWVHLVLNKATIEHFETKHTALSSWFRICIAENLLFLFSPESALLSQIEMCSFDGSDSGTNSGVLVSFLLDFGTFVERLLLYCFDITSTYIRGCCTDILQERCSAQMGNSQQFATLSLSLFSCSSGVSKV